MKNETSIKYFYLLSFSGETRSKPFITAFFFLIYVVGVLINSSIITVICLEVQLHKPMYLFIGNLSIVDILFTSVTIPKLLHMILSGNHIVSFLQCYTQLYCYVTVGTAEETLLFVMAYDRYVAICNPLHYPLILNSRNCSLMTIGIWAAALLNSLLFVTSVLHLSSCHSNIIHQFFCDAKSLTQITCSTTQQFLIVNSVEMLLFAFIPLTGTFTSYFKIFSVIFKMKIKENQKKAFSTCSSHVTVISIFYVSCISSYLNPHYSEVLDSVFTIIYTTIVPMVNPIIYSLQNSNVKTAMLGSVKGKCFRKR
ncbi:hypothetical protein GDO81_028502 [Engystomops pustulosus]|uniref:G-protein coupled receptors family 1 profile domain-containing protein n=1 Tax=Engystomops pustulosus TaxID=76066 RepID=A0AAV6ZN92_ENGPU|nr:hypothetical protein GDO81_028502 [Engystomops pustulosus]